MERIIALAAGLLFGLGLIVAQMTNPSKVIGFLDLLGNWDPSLALVMGSAIVVGLPAFTIARHKTTSWSNTPMQLPKQADISARLIVGSLLFGAGWGLAGYCPGPALVAASIGNHSALVFVGFMLLGFALFAWAEQAKSRYHAKL